MLKRPALGERLLMFHDTLTEIVEFYRKKEPIGLIAYELPYWPQPPKVGAPPPKISAENLQFLQKVEGILQMTATRLKIPYEGYWPASWRVTALGMGFAPKGSPDGTLKKMMVQRAKALGFHVNSEDEADAIGILMHSLHGKPANARNQPDLLSREVDL